MFEFLLGTIFVLTAMGIGFGLIALLWLAVFALWKDL